MTTALVVTLAVVVAASLLFVTEALPFDVTALGIIAVLLVAGVLEPAQALSGFSNQATITIAAMLVLSRGLERTGMLNALAARVEQLARRGRVVATGSLLAALGVLSAFINNTAVVAIAIPVATRFSRSLGQPASRILMPLSFVSIFGGVCTLVGTSTNLLVSSLLVAQGQPGIRMFELLPVGGPLFVVGLAWCVLVAPRLLPARDGEGDLTERFGLDAYLAEVQLRPQFPQRGSDATQAALVGPGQLDLLQVYRRGQALEVEEAGPLEAGDVLRVRGEPVALARLAGRPDVGLQAHGPWLDRDLEEGEGVLIEAVLAPDSNAVGRTVADVDFPRRFGAVVMAVRHLDAIQRGQLAGIRLRGGDSVLLKAPAARIDELRRAGEFVVVSALDLPRYRVGKAPIALAALAGAVLLAALGIVPIVVSTLAAVTALLVTRVITVPEAYDAVNWRVIMLLAGVIPLGAAMEHSGAAALLAESTVDALDGGGLHLVVGGMFLLAVGLTNVMSNVAAAALLVPIAVETAAALALPLRPVAMAVTFGASLSFLTPIGYQTNTLVYGPGGYRFSDFLRVGLPLTVICTVLVVLLVPWAWG